MQEVGVIPADSKVLVASKVEWGSLASDADAVRTLAFPVDSPGQAGIVRGARLSWS
jgi:hypothetical protein